MVLEGAMFLSIILGFGTICVGGLLIASYLRYRVKKTPVTRTLIILHTYYLFLHIFALAGALFPYFDIPLLLSEQDMVIYLFPGNEVLVFTSTFMYQAQYLFLIPTYYYFSVFACLVFFPGEEGKGGTLLKGVKILTAIAFALQVYINSVLVYAIACVMAGITPDYSLVGFSIILLPIIGSILLLVVYGMVVFPAFFISLRLWKQTSYDEPHKPDLLYLAVMSFVVMLTGIFNIWDNLLLLAGVPYPTVILFIVWLCTPVIVYTAYRGYFGGKPAKR